MESTKPELESITCGGDLEHVWSFDYSKRERIKNPMPFKVQKFKDKTYVSDGRLIEIREDDGEPLFISDYLGLKGNGPYAIHPKVTHEIFEAVYDAEIVYAKVDIKRDPFSMMHIISKETGFILETERVERQGALTKSSEESQGHMNLRNIGEGVLAIAELQLRNLTFLIENMNKTEKLKHDGWWPEGKTHFLHTESRKEGYIVVPKYPTTVNSFSSIGDSLYVGEERGPRGDQRKYILHHFKFKE